MTARKSEHRNDIVIESLSKIYTQYSSLF